MNEGVYSRHLSFLRAEGLQRELRQDPRGDCIGRDLSKNCDIICGEGGFCYSGSQGYLVNRMGFLLRNTEAICLPL